VVFFHGVTGASWRSKALGKAGDIEIFTIDFWKSLSFFRLYFYI
jgi:hypothetical protein